MGFTYFQMPKFIFKERYASVDANGKILYMILLDRRKLSEENGLTDDLGVYCFMSREEMSDVTNSSTTSVRKYINQLSDAGLVFEKRLGQGRQNKIYVLIPADQDTDPQNNKVTESKIDSLNNFKPEAEDNDVLERKNLSLINNNKNNKTELNKSISISMAEEMLKDHFEYDQHFAGTLNEDMADAMIKVMADVFASQSGSVRIHKVDTDIDTVKSRLLKLGPAHLDYTIGQIVKSKNKIKGSGAAYMLTCLYDAYANYNLYFSKSYCSNYA